VPRPLFEVKDLRIEVHDPNEAVRAARRGDAGEGWSVGIPGLSFAVAEGEVLGIVGESGAGKSLALLGAFGLLPAGTRAAGGTITFDGAVFRPAEVPSGRRRDGKRRAARRRMIAGTVAADVDDEWARRVGLEVGFLFQNPIAAWNPLETIGPQAGEALDVHTDLDDAEIQRRVVDALGDVQLPRSGRLLGAFRHQMSRGQGQRAMLAAALTKSPRLLIADEPLSGLDPSVAAAILDLIRDLQRRRGMAMVMVTHDLGAIARVADRVAVMYAGRIVEEGPASRVFHQPQHPYTAGLLASVPGLDRRLVPIPGEAPRLGQIARGCPFAPRCGFAEAACLRAEPVLEPIGYSKAACHRMFHLDLEGI